MDVPIIAKDADAFSATGNPLTLVCALAVEERVATKAGARAARVGLRAVLPVPDGRLVSFGLAGSLVDELAAGSLVTATRIVSEAGETIWEGSPVHVEGASRGVICSTDRVVDEPDERRRLARRTGAVAVDTESGPLAASGRLAGSLRAISDTPSSPVGSLASAAHDDGSTNWWVVAKSAITEPVKTMRTARDARRALAALVRAAEALR